MRKICQNVCFLPLVLLRTKIESRILFLHGKILAVSENLYSDIFYTVKTLNFVNTGHSKVNDLSLSGIFSNEAHYEKNAVTFVK